MLLVKTVGHPTIWTTMQQIINLREANQNLSKYIRSLHSGDEIIITKHGKAVAKLIPVTNEKTLNSAQQEALDRLLNRITEGYHLGGQGINRDELYE
jgi:prevent-host-death family protein